MRHFFSSFRKQSQRPLRSVLLFGATAGAFALYCQISQAATSKPPKTDVWTKSIAPKQDFMSDLFKNDSLNIGVWQIPHDQKILKGGEDTYFISKNGKVSGVFDGVGGWARHGVDPREYSYKLSQGCKKAVDEKEITDPLEILTFSYNEAKGITGSTTACLVSIEGNQLKAANIGDSGFLVVRRNELLFNTKEQQFRFDFPYQLGSRDISKPSDADLFTLTLEPMDVIVLVTDGVLDNLFISEIRELVSSNYSYTPQNMAKLICEVAYKQTMDSMAYVPYKHKATELGILVEDGGKKDDITTLVIKYRFGGEEEQK